MINEHEIAGTIIQHLISTTRTFQKLLATLMKTMMTTTIDTKFYWLATLTSQEPTTTPRHQILTATNGQYLLSHDEW